MSGGFILSYRSKFQNWVSDDPKTFMAWDEILHVAAYKPETIKSTHIQLRRGDVIPGDIKSRRFFTDKQWRAFIERLIATVMLELITVHHMGRGNGSKAVYHVKNYESYQSATAEGVPNRVPNRVPKGVSKGASNNSQGQDNHDLEDMSKGSPKGVPKGVSKGASYIRKKQDKQIKEKTPPTPPRGAAPGKLVEVYNQHKPENWSRCDSLNDKRKTGLKRLSKEHADGAPKLLQNALAYACSDPWWAEKSMTIDTILVKGRVLEFSERNSAAKQADKPAAETYEQRHERLARERKAREDALLALIPEDIRQDLRERGLAN